MPIQPGDASVPARVAFAALEERVSQIEEGAAPAQSLQDGFAFSLAAFFPRQANTDLGTAESPFQRIFAATSRVGSLYATTRLGFEAGQGAGGSVTQPTSKATAVTLNKATGRIVTHAASLASAASVIFTLNNSEIGANDTVTVTAAGGASYIALAFGVAAGLAMIRLTNITGGDLAEAVSLNFHVLKGATT